MDTQKSKTGATERRRRRETTTHEVEDEYEGLDWDAKARKANILKRFVSKSKCGFKLLSRFPVTPRDYPSSSVSSSSNEETTRSKGKSSGTKVCLTVYDLTPMNGCVYWAGLGIFHSGVEVHGVEYAFGAHDYPTSGVFEVEPRQCPGFTFRKSIFIGTTQLSPSQLREFMENIAGAYNGDSYHLIAKNCNHFCNDICLKLTGKPIPGWVNRLARIGSVCNCLLPESLHVSAVRHEPDYQSFWSKKNIRRSLFQLSVSRSDYLVGEKQMSHSSMLLSHSPFKGSVLPWEFKSSNTVKER